MKKFSPLNVITIYKSSTTQTSTSQYFAASSPITQQFQNSSNGKINEILYAHQ
jgi:hypothetical protein